jgi:hypothetical protein
MRNLDAADGNAVDIEIAPSDGARNAVEHPGTVLYQRY